MKRLATVALGLAVTIPICAQRGAGRTGFASHSSGVSHAAPAFRGYAPSASMRYRGAPVSRAPYAYPYVSRPAAPSSRYMTVAPPARRPAFYRPTHYPYIDRRRPFIRTYPVGVVGYFPGVFGSDLFDDSFYDQPYYDDSSAYAQPLAPQPDYADSGYPQPDPEDYAPYPQAQYPQPQYSQPEPGQAPAIAPQMQYVPGSADTVTLIFKDGRPPEQIQNYIATKKTLTVINGSRHHDIPIADLDIPATIKANRETGVGFQLPVSR